MQAPGQFLLERRRGVLFTLLAIGVLVLAAGLFFAHRPAPNNELVWLSTAELARISNPGPWTRLKARGWELATQRLPFLRRSRNRRDLYLLVELWRSDLAEGPPRPPLSTNAQGVLAWQMSSDEMDRKFFSLDGTWMASSLPVGGAGESGLVNLTGGPANGIHASPSSFGRSGGAIKATSRVGLVPGGSLLLGSGISTINGGNGVGNLGMTLRSGSRGSMFFDNLRFDAWAKYDSGSTRVLFAAAPYMPSSGHVLPLMKSALGFRTLLANGGGVLLRSAEPGENSCWLLMRAWAMGDQGIFLTGPRSK